MSKLILKLSDLESIEIVAKSGNSFNKIDYCCSDMQAFFVTPGHTFCIGEASAGDLFENFITHFKKALNSELQLHESLTQNLGVMKNEYYYQFPHNKSDFFMVPSASGQSLFWVGSSYEIWNVSGNAIQYLNTWLYNDDKDNIVFEVTPLYKWSFRERELEDLDFVTYDEFMKNYQVLIHRVIPREVAVEWLEQAMKVYRELFSTEEKYLQACKENGW